MTNNPYPGSPDPEDPDGQPPPPSPSPDQPAPPPARGGFGGVFDQLGGRQNLLGILSIVASMLGLCCGPCLGGFSSGGTYLFELPLTIAAIVLGVLHLRRVKDGAATNTSLAIVGIVIGVIGLVLAICLGATNVGSSFHDDVH